MSKKRLRRLRNDSRWYTHLLRTFLSAHRWGLFLIVVVVLSISWLSIYFIDQRRFQHTHLAPGPSSTDYFKESSRNSLPMGLSTGSIGTLFPIIIAIFTLAGFLGGIAKLDEVLSRATNLQKFLEKANLILSDAIANGGQVWVVCHSPFIGNLSLRGRKPQVAFQNQLQHLIKQNKVTIITLTPDKLVDYYARFKGDERYRDAKCLEAYQEMEPFLKQCMLQSDAVAYFGLSEEPEFFLVANDTEAVVATPLFLPRSDSSSSLPRLVELIGFATKDGATYDELLQAAFYYQRKCTTPYAKGDTHLVDEAMVRAATNLGSEV